MRITQVGRLAQSIGARVFGLAIVLLVLMTALVGFLLVQVHALDRQLREITTLHAPLDRELVRLNEAGLRRRLAFERWQGALASGGERAAAIAEASANHARYSREVDDAMRAAVALLGAAPSLDAMAAAHVRIAAILEQIGQQHALIGARQLEAIDLLRQGRKERALELIGVLDELQALLQRERMQMQASASDMLATLARDSFLRHREILLMTLIATACAVLVGLLVAAMVTRRLVRPVQSLLTGVQTAQRGDLRLELPSVSRDEIGELTRAFNFFVGELRQKEHLRTTFGKYLDPRILDRMLSDTGASSAAGERQLMTISFCDLVGFSALSETLTASGMVNLLNRHFTLQAEAIQAQRGVVDKFIGDAVMAFWGPLFNPDGDDAVLACRAALAQVGAIARFRAELPELTGFRRHLPEIDMRVGISSGEVVVGSVGSANTRSYTVMGDTVNIASRLEYANRFYGTRILMGDGVRARAGDAIVCREVDTVRVKGKSEPTTVHELLGMAGEAPAAALELARISTEALAAFRARDWDGAERAYRACQAIASDDGPAQVFLERIARLRINPPPDDWDGIWSLELK